MTWSDWGTNFINWSLALSHSVPKETLKRICYVTGVSESNGLVSRQLLERIHGGVVDGNRDMCPHFGFFNLVSKILKIANRLLAVDGFIKGGIKALAGRVGSKTCLEEVRDWFF